MTGQFQTKSKSGKKKQLTNFTPQTTQTSDGVCDLESVFLHALSVGLGVTSMLVDFVFVSFHRLLGVPRGAYDPNDSETPRNRRIASKTKKATVGDLGEDSKMLHAKFEGPNRRSRPSFACGLTLLCTHGLFSNKQHVYASPYGNVTLQPEGSCVKMTASPSQFSILTNISTASSTMR